ncbi:MAG: hypothetical protein AAF702_22845 [Chloroflexota bacterium]
MKNISENIIAINSAFLIAILFLFANPFSRWGDAIEIASSAPLQQNPYPAPINPVISRIEITQVTQDPGNSVPLIVGKPTFSRVYIDCGEINCQSLPNVQTTLLVTNQAGQLITPVLRPFRSQEQFLGRIEDFVLPIVNEAETLTVRAEFHNASDSETVNFHESRRPTIFSVPIDFDGNEPTSRINNAFALAQQLFPADRINYILLSPQPWSNPICNFRYHAEVRQACRSRSVHTWLEGLHVDLLSSGYFNASANTYIFGWLAEENRDKFPYDGVTYPPSMAAWGSIMVLILNTSHSKVPEFLSMKLVT